MTHAAALWAPVHQPESTVAWPDYFARHRDDPMHRQLRDWTCSACSIDWVALATNLDPYSTREKVVGELGYPECIDEEQGLLDTRCAIRVMEAWNVGVNHLFPRSFEEAYDICSGTTGLLNNKIWQHFVAIRGTAGPRIWVANSAPGYRGIYDTIDRRQWDAWGTWNIVALVP
jgi:hypothetical protein